MCGGFLKWLDPNPEDDHAELIPICTKCGAELIAIPELDEETKEPLPWGKICPISKPKKLKEHD